MVSRDFGQLVLLHLSHRRGRIASSDAIRVRVTAPIDRDTLTATLSRWERDGDVELAVAEVSIALRTGRRYRLNNCRSTSFMAGLSGRLPGSSRSGRCAGAAGIDGTGAAGAAMAAAAGSAAAPGAAGPSPALPQSLLDQIAQGFAELAAEHVVQSAAGRGSAAAALPPGCAPPRPPSSSSSPPPSLPNRPLPISFSLA